MPEPQSLLMVTQPADVGIPAVIAAWRAGPCFIAPTSTHPITT